ncbi:MAG: hypothetical protein OXD30_13775 [Bryobacterales bacterium]|nr:hypothetical protein [Bryobacterales bacterium]
MTRGDDGGFAAEYVRPAPFRVPLGTSGSSVEARINEDGTFSALLGGEWTPVTESTQVTAANGNRYGVSLVGDVPVPVYIDQVVTVTLGELGGPLQLTQNEEMTWWLDEMQVESGYVHTVSVNGNENRYVLTLDEAGMWSAVYQQNMVTVRLGTQGSVTLTRNEAGSWWLGTEAVASGDVEVADNGNEYVLTYADGAWSAQFRPMSLEIEGTGLVAMTREADDMYDVTGGGTLPASGIGDVSEGDAMYHVWMAAGGLAGARFDDEQKDGRSNVGGIGNPKLSEQDDGGLLKAMGIEDKETIANELQTHLKVKGEYFSLGALLGTGQATRVGDDQSTIVSTALDAIRELRQRASVSLNVFSESSQAANLNSALTSAWNAVDGEVDKIFGEDKVSLARQRNDDRILGQFDRIIEALSDESAFQDATSSGGVFEDADLSASAAAAAFAAEKKEALATFGALGNTRFGTFWRKQRADATAKLADPAAGNLGAFAYGTAGTLKTLRTRYVRQGTGSAIYAGRTEAIDGEGAVFSGNIDIQVRFAAERVDAVITNLEGESGPWEYLYANVDVAQIVIPDAKLGNAASWNDSGSNASVTYATRVGIPRPLSADWTFKGQLLGRDAGDQGNEAVGVWTLGSAGGGSDYLMGGFGALRGDDLPDTRPRTDSGAGAETKVLPYGDILTKPVDPEGEGIQPGEDPFHASDNPNTRGQTIADGMLTVTGQQFDVGGMLIADIGGTTDGNQAKYRSHEIDLEAAVEANAKAWANGPKHVDLAKDVIEKQLAILELDLEGFSDNIKRMAWQRVQDAIVSHLFGYRDQGTDITDAEIARAALPGQLGALYDADKNDDFVNAVGDVLDALQSNDALKAALEVNGIFHRKKQGAAVLQLANPNGEGVGGVNLFARRASRVEYLFGSTDFTRFGAWRRQTSPNAREAYVDRTESDQGNGPNALAYSPLGKASYNGPSDPRYPLDARMTYEGDAVAVVGGDFFQGSVDIEVLWGQTSVEGNNEIDAKLNMSISDIENVANGDRMYLDMNTGENGSGAALLEEVVSIAINDIDVAPDLSLAATDGTTNATVDVMSEQAGTVALRTTPWVTDLSANDNADAVMGNFVGQSSAGGPLAVLGTWRMSNNSNDNDTAAIGAMKTGKNSDGDVVATSVTGATFSENDGTFGTFEAVTIHGGFGAELP